MRIPKEALYRASRIYDQFTAMPMSRQFRHNLRCRLQGLCWQCSGVPSKKLVKSTGQMKALTRCDRCLERARKAAQARRERLKISDAAPAKANVKKVVRPKPPVEILAPSQQRSRSRYFTVVGTRLFY
jgi:hypothetical protein